MYIKVAKLFKSIYLSADNFRLLMLLAGAQHVGMLSVCIAETTHAGPVRLETYSKQSTPNVRYCEANAALKSTWN